MKYKPEHIHKVIGVPEAHRGAEPFAPLDYFLTRELEGKVADVQTHVIKLTELLSTLRSNHAAQKSLVIHLRDQNDQLKRINERLLYEIAVRMSDDEQKALAAMHVEKKMDELSKGEE